jgi:hypothetical protein
MIAINMSMPIDCMECRLSRKKRTEYYSIEYRICLATGLLGKRLKHSEGYQKRPEWCPLKEMKEVAE